MRSFPDFQDRGSQVYRALPKAESRHGQRLNPRKADLNFWRERFAEQSRESGIDAEATPMTRCGRPLTPRVRRGLPLRSPKKRGPLQAVPVMARAMVERLA